MRKKPVIEPMDMGKVPPQSIELEEAVLGGLIFDSKVLVELLPILKAEVFYKEVHQLICTAILSLVEKDAPVDMITVVNECKKLGTLEQIGGAYYIAQISKTISTTANTSYHYRILLEYYFRRELIRISSESSSKAHDDTEDVFNTVEAMQSMLEEIDTQVAIGSHINAKEVYRSLLDEMTREHKPVSFIPIGDLGIDQQLMISPGNLINISGKSGSGKTSFITYLARSILTSYKDVAILWYSMEDDANKILCSFISPDVKLTHSQIHEKDYKLTIKDKEMISKESKKFAMYDIEFVESASYISHIKTHFMRFCSKRPNKFNFLIIDNIMLLKDNQSNRFKSRQTETDDHIASQIQNTFVSTKNNYNVNIWFVHHLTKEQLVKTNFAEGYRPTEDNIRGSARLRDMVTQGLLINRPGEFQDIIKTYKKTDLEGPIKNLMIIDVFKNRNHRTGFIRYFANLDYKIFYPF